MRELVQALIEALNTVLLGKEEQVKLALACLFARGHLLIEDMPGMGKTLLSHALAQVLGLSYNRIQFTSDVLPTDIIGTSIFDKNTSDFRFIEGPLFAQVVLADEINRATPKSQSALLEAMEERQVTAEGETRPLPKPFFVIATQNPATQTGTFPLSESQLDRFLMRIEIGYPDPDAERELLRGGDRRAILESIQPVMDLDSLSAMQSAVDEVKVSDPLIEYIQRLVGYSRTQPYQYTLNPPRLNEQGSVDQFWFETRAGFCTHYASAFVYMMRAVGVPARMVGGYQGGEINPITNHLMVRQYDAHAWAEIWLPEAGWSRVDPTGAVTPERIERGLTAALSAADLARLSLFTSARFGDWRVVNDLLYWADSVEHRWNLWVVGYDSSFQAEFLMRMLGDITRLRIGIAILIGGGLSVGFVALSLFWRRRSVKRYPVERLFRNFASKAEGHGFPRAPRESPAAFVRRVAGETGVRESQVQRIIAQLNTLLYNPAVPWGSAELNQLRRALRGLRFRLAFASAR